MLYCLFTELPICFFCHFLFESDCLLRIRYFGIRYFDIRNSGSGSPIKTLFGFAIIDNYIQQMYKSNLWICWTNIFTFYLKFIFIELHRSTLRINTECQTKNYQADRKKIEMKFLFCKEKQYRKKQLSEIGH